MLVPFEFVEKEAPLTWADLLWGYRRSFLSWRDLVHAAEKKVAEGSSNDLEIELASVDKESVWKVSELAERLAAKDDGTQNQSKMKWLFLVLAWLFEKRFELDDPLGKVEEIYADFDYPSEIESFVRYMPPTDGYAPQEHSKEENYTRLIRKWGEFLENFRKQLSR
jgi:hypothetical protein